MPRCGHCPNRGNKSGSTNFVTWRQGTIFCLVFNLAFIGRREFGIRQGNARKGSAPFANDGHFSKCDSQEIAWAVLNSSGGGREGPYPGGGKPAYGGGVTNDLVVILLCTSDQAVRRLLAHYAHRCLRRTPIAKSTPRSTSRALLGL